jgi:hypothetical protein
MALGYATALRNNQLTQVSNAIDAGTTGGFLRIYSGTRPATGGAVTTLLAQLQFSTTSHAAPSGGSMTANAITADASADATGTATWFRVVDDTAAFVMDGDVGTSGSDLNLNSTSITAGGTVSVTSWVLTCGNP